MTVLSVEKALIGVRESDPIRASRKLCGALASAARGATTTPAADEDTSGGRGSSFGSHEEPAARLGRTHALIDGGASLLACPVEAAAILAISGGVDVCVRVVRLGPLMQAVGRRSELLALLLGAFGEGEPAIGAAGASK